MTLYAFSVIQISKNSRFKCEKIPELCKQGYRSQFLERGSGKFAQQETFLQELLAHDSEKVVDPLQSKSAVGLQDLFCR